MKKSLFIAITACLGLILPFSSAGLTKELAPYVIGFSCDLSGLRAEVGIPEKRGAEIALDEINAAGGVNGRQLKAVYYDHAGDPAQAVKNTKRIIEVDRAIACLGYEGVSITFASIGTAIEAKTLLFSGGPAIVTGAPTKEWLFTVVPDQKIASIPILIKSLLARGCSKIAYIHTDTSYGALGLKAFNWSCKKLGIIPTIIEKYAPDTIDFSPQLSHIKASGADGLLITGNVPDTVKVLKTASDLGIDYPILSDYAIVGPEFIDLGGKYVEGLVSTSLRTLVAPDLPKTDPQKKVCMELYDAYTKKHKTISLYAGHGWDQVYLLAKALKKVDPNLDPTKDADLAKIRAQLRENLERVQGFVGQNGIFNYSRTDHIGLAEGCYVPVVVKSGKWVLYTK
jgi:branched-chain amino acid transport system substrate-binding protein